MSLNSNWFQNDQPSKLSDGKNISFSTKTDFILIIQLGWLLFLEPVGVQRHYVPHLKSLINVQLEPTCSRA